MILEVFKLSHSSFWSVNTQDVPPLYASFYPHPLSFCSSILFPVVSPSSHTAFYLLLHLPPICLTGGDDALQPDDVGVVKLSQDASLAEKGAALFVRAAGP